MSRRRRLRTGLLAALATAALAVSAPAAGADTLTTTFEGGNGYEGNGFDLEVKPEGGILVTGIDVHLGDTEEPNQIEVWTRPGTAVGHESSPEGWTLRGSATVASAGNLSPTPTPISFELPQGSYGVIVGGQGAMVEYSDGNAVFEDSALKLTSGTGLEAPFFDPSLAVIDDRIWNGSIHYNVLPPPSPPVVPPVAPPAPGPPAAAPCDSSAAKAKLKRRQAKLRGAQRGLAQARDFAGRPKARKAKVAAAKGKVRAARGGVKAARRALAKAC